MPKNKSILFRACKQYQLFIMMVPMLIMVTIFSYVPLSGWVMAFTDYKLGKGLFSGDFIGLKEFASFFNGTYDAGYVIRNTLVVNLLSLFINLICACLFAVLLNEIRCRWVKNTVQTFSFFPYFVSWVITYSIFNSFLAVNSGALNQIMISLKIIDKGIDYLSNPAYSWGVILFVNLWKSIGYNSVIFLASIAGIDQEQYESASIDGASRIQKIIYITLPALAPTFVMLLLMNSGWIFSSNFEEFYMFSNASNWERMEMLDIYIYRYGLKLLNFSYSTAVGIVKTFAGIFMFTIVNLIAKKISKQSLL